VKTRTQAGQTLTYISIDATINRLNDVLGPNWSTYATTSVTELPNDAFLAVVELNLTATIDGVEKKAYGVGADKGKDVDKIAKTALAEALKKAGHQLGIALYLWDADGRKRAETRMKLDKNRDSEATLKRAVFDLAKAKNADVSTAADVAKVFGVKPGELSDKDVLVRILEGEGVL